MNKCIVKTKEELITFLDSLGSAIAFDTETTGKTLRSMNVDMVQITDGKTVGVILLPLVSSRAELVAILKERLESDKFTTFIAHNIVYDMKALSKLGISLKGKKLYDTMVADHLIDENRGHSLKNLAKCLLCYTNVQKYEQAAEKGHWHPQFIEYAMNDAIYTWELMRWQQPALKKMGLVKLFREIEMPFMWTIYEMETTGMLIDVVTLKEISKQLEVRIEDVMTEMLEILGERPLIQTDLDGKFLVISPINFGSGPQLADILFKQLGLRVVEQTPKGAPSVGKFTIETLKNEHPFVEKLWLYKKLQKLQVAYFSPDAQIMSHIEEDGKVRPSFIDIGTKTGRLSCRQPNLQQLPKNDKNIGIPSRSVFVVPQGYRMITADYSGQEIAVMAEISKDKTLVESLNKGYDMHLAVANQFYGLNIPSECLNSGHEEYEHYKDRFKSERTKAKTITFGLAYGKGAYGFSKDFGITEDEAQKIVDDYFAGMPGLKEAIDKAHAEVRESGIVTNMAGRQRHFEMLPEGYYPSGAYRQAFNFKIQGFAADMIRMACNNIYKAKEEHPEWDLRFIATVHDEVVLQVKEQYVNEACILIKQGMETAVTFVVPTPADISVGRNYDEAK